ncbi:MAG TPA: ribonuclease III, partial [Oxalicibacterium sp.]|nr:ribonuclease III [Oxalicibacterium sp.]
SAGRKSKPRTAQLKLAGIATVQPDAPAADEAPKQKASAKSDKNADKSAKTEAKQPPVADADNAAVHDGQKSLIADEETNKPSSDAAAAPLPSQTRTA